MSAIDVETFKSRADEFIAKAIAGEPTVIEQKGKRAVILACEEDVPDFEAYPEIDALLRKRLEAPESEPTPRDWQALRDRIKKK
jgi:PHD/YefM family antitoxin component YafN of YafNO toxin-antitoxin module